MKKYSIEVLEVLSRIVDVKASDIVALLLITCRLQAISKWATSDIELLTTEIVKRFHIPPKGF